MGFFLSNNTLILETRTMCHFTTSTNRANRRIKALDKAEKRAKLLADRHLESFNPNNNSVGLDYWHDGLDTRDCCQPIFGADSEYDR
jgi:hypothetical protein